MQAVALALVLISGQTPDFYQDEAPEQPSRVREARAGLGTATILTLDGVGAVAEAGLELKPWGPVALRVTVGGSAKVGWGSFSIAPEAVFRMVDIDRTFSPYLALGASFALVNITNQALGIDPIPTYRPSQGAAGSNEGPVLENPNAGGSYPGTPVEFSFGPQATAGLRFQAFRSVALDLGVRYTMLRFDGDIYNNVGIVLTFCAPAG